METHPASTGKSFLSQSKVEYTPAMDFANGHDDKTLLDGLNFFCVVASH